MPKLWSLVEAKGKGVKNDCTYFIVVLHCISVSREEVRVNLQSGKTCRHWPFSYEYL